MNYISQFNQYELNYHDVGQIDGEEVLDMQPKHILNDYDTLPERKILVQNSGSYKTDPTQYWLDHDNQWLLVKNDLISKFDTNNVEVTNDYILIKKVDGWHYLPITSDLITSLLYSKIDWTGINTQNYILSFDVSGNIISQQYLLNLQIQDNTINISKIDNNSGTGTKYLCDDNTWKIIDTSKEFYQLEQFPNLDCNNTDIKFIMGDSNSYEIKNDQSTLFFKLNANSDTYNDDVAFISSIQLGTSNQLQITNKTGSTGNLTIYEDTVTPSNSYISLRSPQTNRILLWDSVQSESSSRISTLNNEYITKYHFDTQQNPTLAFNELTDFPTINITNSNLTYDFNSSTQYLQYDMTTGMNNNLIVNTLFEYGNINEYYTYFDNGLNQEYSKTIYLDGTKFQTMYKLNTDNQITINTGVVLNDDSSTKISTNNNQYITKYELNNRVPDPNGQLNGKVLTISTNNAIWNYPDLGYALGSLTSSSQLDNYIITNNHISTSAGISISKLQNYPSNSSYYLRGDSQWTTIAAGAFNLGNKMIEGGSYDVYACNNTAYSDHRGMSNATASRRAYALCGYYSQVNGGESTNCSEFFYQNSFKAYVNSSGYFYTSSCRDGKFSLRCKKDQIKNKNYLNRIKDLNIYSFRAKYKLKHNEQENEDEYESNLINIGVMQDEVANIFKCCKDDHMTEKYKCKQNCEHCEKKQHEDGEDDKAGRKRRTKGVNYNAISMYHILAFQEFLLQYEEDKKKIEEMEQNISHGFKQNVLTQLEDHYDKITNNMIENQKQNQQIRETTQLKNSIINQQAEKIRQQQQQINKTNMLLLNHQQQIDILKTEMQKIKELTKNNK